VVTDSERIEIAALNWPANVKGPRRLASLPLPAKIEPPADPTGGRHELIGR